MEEPGTAAARLVVSFRPDPQYWPADLLAAEGRRP
jgi:arsenite-transporting ATPase